ncbi:hypothetical protein AB0F72_09010 [Actinoplanes sp. NPDC023936]
MQSLIMADGKDRMQALADFDDHLHSPLGGSSVDLDERLNREFMRPAD